MSFGFIEYQLTQCTGVISLAFLTVVMLLAIKPRWLTSKLVNKSQCYQRHKQFRIGSGIALIIHWLIANDVVLTQCLFGVGGNMQNFDE
ncbi:hypothetical protein BCU12_22505 [Vibrio sp. 10N.261.55.A7]|nr:hypothetical protein BCU12_22505 [Vibrio sp. 10N.261.55.A7]